MNTIESDWIAIRQAYLRIFAFRSARQRKAIVFMGLLAVWLFIAFCQQFFSSSDGVEAEKSHSFSESFLHEGAI